MSLIGEDCHYFITSTCTRGNQCCFRHQPAAKTTEQSCPEWIQGKCLNPNCNLRHIAVDRTGHRNKLTPKVCFYDSQPTGCLNPLCKFVHTKKKAVEPVVIPNATPLAKPVLENPVAPVNPTPVVAKPVQPTLAAPTIVKQPVSQVVPKLIPPPAPLHTLQPAIRTPTLINGVLNMVPARGILGANPNQAPQILPPLATHHGLRQQIAGQPLVNRQPVIVGQPDNNNGLPKTGHFNEQVRLFKEMLSSKQKQNQNDIKPNAKNNRDYHGDSSDYDYDSEKEERERDRERRNKDKYRKKNKKERHGRHKKRSKDDLSKADQEVLYGDYKDVPLDRRHKKGSRESRHASSDSDVKVKSYEEILREKALRKMIEKKKKEKNFEDDFQDILEAEDSKSSSNKKSSSDGEVVSKGSRNQDVDLESVVFDKEDALEVGVDEDEFDAEVDDKRHSKSRRSKTRKRSSEKENIEDSSLKSSAPSPTSQEVKTDMKRESGDEELDYNDDLPATEDGVLVIPDETTDLTFSVDVTDDLAQELNSEPEERSKHKKKPIKIVKKIPSVASRISKHTSNDTTRDRRQERSKNKRTIQVVDDESPDPKKEKSEPGKKTETKKVISLVGKKGTGKNDSASTEEKDAPEVVEVVKIKTFEEIMAEKRKRKLQKADVVVVSDSDSLESPDKKPFSDSSSKMKGLLSIATVSQPAPPPKTAAQLRREKLQLAKQEYEKRRKSQQLYQVKSSQAATTKPLDVRTASPVKTPITAPTSTETNAAKTIKLTRPTVTAPTKVANAPTTENASGVSVRSFEEIMKEKSLRKQREMQGQQNKVEAKPIQSFLRRRSLSNQRNQTQPETSTTVSNDSTKSTEKTVPATAAVIAETETAKETTTTVLPPVAKIIGRRRSSSPLQPGVEVTKVAPIKIKRKLSSSSSSDLAKSRTQTPPPQVVPTIPAKSDDVFDTLKDVRANNESSTNGASPIAEETEQLSQASMEDIQEALDEKQREREQEMLSDDEFDRLNDLLSDDDGDEDGDEVNDDDFMMELEQMIDS